MHKSTTSMIALAGANLAAALHAKGEVQERRIFGAEPIRRMLQRQKRDYSRDAHNSIATGNRWGGAHLHQRERARNARRARSA